MRTQLRQPRPAAPDAGILQALMLPVQRQMPGELVEKQTDDEAHVGTAAFDDADRRRPLDLEVGDRNGFDRHAGFVKEQRRFVRGLGKVGTSNQSIHQLLEHTP